MQQEGTRFIAELTKGKNLIFIFKNKGNPLFKMAMKFGATSFDHAVVIVPGKQNIIFWGPIWVYLW